MEKYGFRAGTDADFSSQWPFSGSLLGQVGLSAVGHEAPARGVGTGGRHQRNAYEARSGK